MNMSETIIKEKNEEMSAQDLCEIFCKTRPELFNHIFKECKVIYEGERHKSDDDLYFENEELNIAKAIVYDYGTRANKIGEIIVASTK